MPKRKATKLSGLLGSDDEDVMQVNGAPEPEEPPVKRARGRPKSLPQKPAEEKPATGKGKTRGRAKTEEPVKKPTRRGRPRGSEGRNSEADADADAQNVEDYENAQEEAVSNDEVDAPGTQTKTKTGNGKPTRGRRKASAEKEVTTDGEFEYTPTQERQVQVRFADVKESPAKKRGRPSIDEFVPETQQSQVDESIIRQEPPIRRISKSPTKSGFDRAAAQRILQDSPSKRKGSDAELRRRLGDLTKKYDTLENRYNRLKEIGIVEANANMDKLRKHCETITEDSNNLIASLREQIQAQSAQGQQSRSLQQQLRERDAEVAQYRSQAEEATTQLSAAQNEAKALQTKLTAARNTAASLEGAARAPGSAAKNTPANRAQTAEAAQAAQFAQLKEDLYSDLTGLIIRDVKKRESDYLYDCIQTGANGTLHFKLAVPHVSPADYQLAEFQYIPLLDESRDRELVDILPDYLTVDITFSRQQASKFYTRVIDTLTKRRASQGG